jgi:hypothetical protein
VVEVKCTAATNQSSACPNIVNTSQCGSQNTACLLADRYGNCRLSSPRSTVAENTCFISMLLDCAKTAH